MTAGGPGELESIVAQLRDEVQRERQVRERAEAGLTEALNERTLLAEQLAQSERQNQTLLNLYAASERLHSSLDREDVLAGIQEIVINLIGSEELGVFELSEDGKSLRLVSAFGIEPGSWEGVTLGRGLIGEAAQRGEPFVPQSAPGSQLTAVVPLKVEGRLIGAVAVFRLLPQKHELGPDDHQLFDLLATHGALALYSAALAGKGRRP